METLPDGPGGHCATGVPTQDRLAPALAAMTEPGQRSLVVGPGESLERTQRETRPEMFLQPGHFPSSTTALCPEDEQSDKTQGGTGSPPASVSTFKMGVAMAVPRS